MQLSKQPCTKPSETREGGKEYTEDRNVEYKETSSNLWSTSVPTSHRHERIVRGQGVTGSPTSGRIIKQVWKRGGVGRAIRHLRRALRSRVNRRRLVLGVFWGSVTLHESAGRCDPGPPPPHDEPDDESGEHTEGGETSYDTPSDCTDVRTNSPVGISGSVCRIEVAGVARK